MWLCSYRVQYLFGSPGNLAQFSPFVALGNTNSGYMSSTLQGGFVLTRVVELCCAFSKWKDISYSQ